MSLSSLHQPAGNRRQVLSFAGAAALSRPAGALPTPSIDPHPAWLAEWRRLHDWCNGPGPGDQDVQDLPGWQRIEALEALIVDTPAATRAGLTAQAEFALAAIANDRDEEDFAHRIEVRALKNIVVALGNAQRRI